MHEGTARLALLERRRPRRTMRGLATLVGPPARVAALEEADAFKQNWRDTYDKWTDAKPVYDQMRTTARDLMPPVADDGGEEE